MVKEVIKMSAVPNVFLFGNTTPVLKKLKLLTLPYVAQKN